MGGGGPPDARVGSLDMTNGNDRRSLLAALRDDPDNRFGVLDKPMRDDFTRALKVAMRWALEKQDHRAVNGCVMTMAVLEKMQQADQHLIYKAAHPGGDGPTVNIILNVPAPRVRSV